VVLKPASLLCVFLRVLCVLCGEFFHFNPMPQHVALFALGLALLAAGGGLFAAGAAQVARRCGANPFAVGLLAAGIGTAAAALAGGGGGAPRRVRAGGRVPHAGGKGRTGGGARAIRPADGRPAVAGTRARRGGAGGAGRRCVAGGPRGRRDREGTSWEDARA